jgi:hypothetical protein
MNSSSLNNSHQAPKDALQSHEDCPYRISVASKLSKIRAELEASLENYKQNPVFMFPDSGQVSLPIQHAHAAISINGFGD